MMLLLQVKVNERELITTSAVNYLNGQQQTQKGNKEENFDLPIFKRVENSENLCTRQSQTVVLI